MEVSSHRVDPVELTSVTEDPHGSFKRVWLDLEGIAPNRIHELVEEASDDGSVEASDTRAPNVLTPKALWCHGILSRRTNPRDVLWIVHVGPSFDGLPEVVWSFPFVPVRR